MASKIAWTNETWNFLGGCTPISDGCKHCAAARQAQWLVNMGNKKYKGLVKNGKWTGEVRLFPKEIEKPLHWRNPRMIFPAFMGDLFHEKVPFEFIDQVMFVIYKSYKNGHVYQILTKRPERMSEYFSGDVDMRILKLFRKTDLRCNARTRLTDSIASLPNIHLGVTCENQAMADERIPILLQIPAAVRFVSIEPMLGPVDIVPYMGGRAYKCKCKKAWHHTESNRMIPHGKIEHCLECGTDAEIFPTLDWVIVGCESGPKRRPCKLEWVRDIVQQCKAANVPVFVKQLEINGKVEHDMSKFPEDLRIQEKGGE